MNPLSLYQGFVARTQSLLTAEDAVLLFLRVWVSKIFYLSGRTKAGDGYLELNAFTPTLFEEEYSVPLLDPELAAQLALYGETFLPLMLIFGLLSRVGAAGLIVMTAVIQMSYAGHSWVESVTWLGALIPVLLMGPGRISVDAQFGRKTG